MIRAKQMLDLISFYNKKIHSPGTIISTNVYFRFIQLIMYVVFIIDDIHHLMNESKREYFISKFMKLF